MRRCPPANHCSGAGFSLVEMIVVIMVASIMALGVVDFITNSSEGYVRTANRNQVAAAGRVVIDRIAMELHNALPYSVRVEDFGSGNDQCIEFIPVEAASTYLNPPFRPAAVSDTPFETVHFIPTQDGETDRYAVIYPTRTSDLYGASFTGPATEAIVELSTITAGSAKDELTPAYEHRFKRRSPQQRIFIVSEPVSFCVVGSKLYRYSAYGFEATQPVPGSGLPATTPGRALISDKLDITASGFVAFEYQEPTRRRHGIVQIHLNFNQDGEVVLLNHEVQLRTTP